MIIHSSTLLPVVQTFILSIIILVIGTNVCALEIETQEVSPDKSSVALAYDDNIIRLYSVVTGELVQEFKGHTKSIYTLHFNSDGTQLISGGLDNHVILWNVSTGKVVKDNNIKEMVEHAYFTVNDSYIALLLNNQHLMIYNPSLSKREWKFPIINSLAVSDNRRFFVGETDNSLTGGPPSTTIIDFGNNKHVIDIPIDSNDDHMFFNPGKNILIIRNSSTFHSWDIPNNRKLATIDVDISVEYSTVNPATDNEILIYGEDVIETWDYKTGKKLKRTVLSGLNIRTIDSVSISADGKNAVVSVSQIDYSDMVYTLDMTTYKIRSTISPMSQVCNGSQFIDNNMVLLYTQYPYELWDIQKNTVVHRFVKGGSRKHANFRDIIRDDFKPFIYGGTIYGIDVAANGNVIITGNETPPMSSIEINEHGQFIDIYKNNYICGYDTSYSNSGKLAAFAYNSEQLLISDTTSKNVNAEYDLSGSPRILKFSKNDQFLAAGSDDCKLDIFAVDTKKRKYTKQFYTDIKKEEECDGVYSLAWLSVDQLLVGTLEKLYLVNIEKGDSQEILQSGVTALDTYSVGNDLKFVAVGRYEETIVILDSNLIKINEIEEIAAGRIAISNGGDRIIYNTQAIHQKGDDIIYGSVNEIHVWDIEKNSKIECLGPKETINAMSYDSQNGKIYAGGDDGKVFVWNLKGQLLN